MTATTFGQLLQEYGGDEPVPNGGYDIEVIKATPKMSKTNPPKHMIDAQFRILTGPFANKVVSNNFVLTPDDRGPMYYWFRNFGALGLDHNFWQALNGTIEESLPYVAQAIVGRQCHIEVETKNGRQNVTDFVPLAGPIQGAAPMPQAPQAGYGMQGMAPPPQYPQVQPGMMPGMPQAPQPQVGPPGMPAQAPQYQAPAPLPAPPGMPGVAPMPQAPPAPGYPQPQAMPPQAPQPMAAPPPPGGMVPQAPQPVAPEADGGANPAHGVAYMEQPLPTPPGFPGAAPDQGQVAPVTPLPGVAVDPNGQVPQPQFPQPGSPPPAVPI